MKASLTFRRYDADEAPTTQEVPKDVPSAPEPPDAPTNDLLAGPDNVAQGIETDDIGMSNMSAAELPSNGFHSDQHSYQGEAVNGNGYTRHQDEDTNMEGEHQGAGIKEDG